MTYFAHSGTPGDISDWQSMVAHTQGVVAEAAAFARPFGLDRAASAIAAGHDLGKYDLRFPQRLHGANVRVDHSTAGANIILERARGRDAVMAELIAYGILGHHAGLPDKEAPDASCFTRRIAAFENRLDPVWETEIPLDVTGLMPDHLVQKLSSRGRHAPFDLSVVARFLFSCLVDADFKDTEAYYAPREGRVPDRDWAPLASLLDEFIARFDAHMAQVSAHASGDAELNALRGQVLAHVRGNAGMTPGLFTLTVPTGGGKTLASLGFALEHARIHGHRRIIYAIPFTSIVDQTADVFREVLGNDHILEHHSAIEEDEQAPRKGERTPNSRDRLKLAMEDWAAPVIVTTNVQLFESLFASRTSRARKLHNIAGSVIILDEAQTLPRHLLIPCMRMLDSLAHLLGCSIVLCTATQPALGAPGFPGQQGLLLDGRELAPDPHGLARRLRRARIERAGPMDNDALVSALAAQSQGLIIVNSRRHALDLYRAAEAAGLEGLVHLTTRQCAAHRRQTLGAVRERLKNGLLCRVIATSLIEAGVDVDFPRVWRAQAGWDQVMQAAGRCNREGRRLPEESIVTLFEAPDYPPPTEIREMVGAADRALARHGDAIQSLAAMEEYFHEVYWSKGDRLDGLEPDKAILPRLTVSAKGGTGFAFRSIAADFRMIDSDMQPVIIPFDDKARQAVDELGIEAISSGAIARKLQTYLVLVPPKVRDMLIRNGHAGYARPDLRGDQFVVLKSAGLYTKAVGLLWEEAGGLGDNAFI